VADLLIYSLAEFREVIFAALDLVGATSVVEVGGEDGLFTRQLLSWAEGSAAAIDCIDPLPSDGLVELMRTSPAGQLHRCRGVEAIPEIGEVDVYLIDGDHNHHTVMSELKAVEKACQARWPLVAIHDVGWPSARRDMYYDPASIPDRARHPYDYARGTTLDSSDLVEDGFRGAGSFAWAVYEGGAANGVLTAIEDFLADRPHLELHVVPCVFGLGVVFSKSSPHADGLRQILSSHEGNPLLERLERNRLELYLHVLRLQHDLDRSKEEAALQVRDLEVENRGLWARVGELEGQLRETTERFAALAVEVASTVGSRSFVVAERLSRLHRRLGHGPGISGERLRSLSPVEAPHHAQRRTRR